eukprot:1593273-Pleurochrysis_carterae.AAC.2
METQANAKANKRTRQRRLIQQRIRKWNKATKRKYDGKDRMQYRHKVRASKRWQQRKDTSEANRANAKESRKRGGRKCMRRKCRTEAREANYRQGKNRAEMMKEGHVKRKGGAEGRKGARMVKASNVEEGLMRDIGVP